MPVSLFGLIILFAVFAVAGWMIKEATGSTLAGLAAPFVGLFLIGAVMVYALFSFKPITRTVVQDQTTTDRLVRLEESRSQITADDSSVARNIERQPASVWEKLDYRQFRASVFPGIDQAAEQLARQILDPDEGLVSGELPDYDIINLVAVSEDKQLTRSASTIAKELARQKKNIVVSTLAATAEDDNGKSESETPAKEVILEILIDLEVDGEQPSAWDSKVKLKSGQITATRKDAEGTRISAVRFTEKPWLDATDEFRSRNAGNRYVIAMSPSTCESQKIASILVERQLPELVAGTVNGRPIVMSSSDAIVDRFSQKLSRPYGTVWREAVLVDMQSEKLTIAKRQAINDAMQHVSRVHVAHQSEMLRGFGLMAVFAGIGIFGFLLNFITQGYYRSRIVIWAICGFLLLAVITGA